MSLKVAVIGVGYLGKHHARIYSELPDDLVELVAVVDANAKAASAVSASTGAAAVSDFREVLDQVDALSIVTPTSLHYDISL